MYYKTITLEMATVGS